MAYRSVPAHARLTAVLGVLAVVLLFLTTSARAAGPPENFAAKVTFIGDSVTAGFGYCGHEDKWDVTCGLNGEMANRWVGFSSLAVCKPPEAPNDACSNNNYKGKPWSRPPWTKGSHAPDIAYPFQLAKEQAESSVEPKAVVSDWAMTGSTPIQWDPRRGLFARRETDPTAGMFAKHLGELNHQYVGMTLGANPLLSEFTDVEYLDWSVTEGKCVPSTGHWDEGAERWYAGPLANPLRCLRTRWDDLHQTEHLAHVYEALLEQGNRVIVLGYYRGCSWSFGNWQPSASFIHGPAYGRGCKTELRPISKTDPTKVSQWEQAIAIGSGLDNLIQKAVERARHEAAQKWPNTNRAQNIVFTVPDAAEWEAHQPHSPNGSWVFLNDTWIHPSKAGATNLAKTFAAAMCASFGHWCAGAGPGLNW